MPPTANVFWSESLPPQLSLGKDAGCCRGLLVIDIVTRPLQYVEAHPVFQGVVSPSSDQSAHERAEQLLASLAGIVNELE